MLELVLSYIGRTAGHLWAAAEPHFKRGVADVDAALPPTIGEIMQTIMAAEHYNRSSFTAANIAQDLRISQARIAHLLEEMRKKDVTVADSELSDRYLLQMPKYWKDRQLQEAWQLRRDLVLNAQLVRTNTAHAPEFDRLMALMGQPYAC